VDSDGDLRVSFADGRALCLHPQAVTLLPEGMCQGGGGGLTVMMRMRRRMRPKLLPLPRLLLLLLLMLVTPTC
jgi:hypothetical protein